MLRAKLAYKTIKEDTDNFSLKGMVEPTFYNFGEENVRILHSIVKPNESFRAGTQNMVMDNEIPISFEGENKAGRNLKCYWVAPQFECD